MGRSKLTSENADQSQSRHLLVQAPLSGENGEETTIYIENGIRNLPSAAFILEVREYQLK